MGQEKSKANQRRLAFKKVNGLFVPKAPPPIKCGTLKALVIQDNNGRRLQAIRDTEEKTTQVKFLDGQDRLVLTDAGLKAAARAFGALLKP